MAIEVDRVDGEDFKQCLRDVEALKQGHFLLASGRHSNQYVEKFNLLRLPRETQKVCEGIYERFRDANIDVVAGPTTGGVILAYEVARQLGSAAAYAERCESAPGREFRRGTRFSPGSRVLLVDDILTTGGSVRETLEALTHHPVEVIAVAVLVDRSGGSVTFSVPLTALVTLDVETWAPAECPQCTLGEPLAKSGSTVASGVTPGTL